MDDIVQGAAILAEQASQQDSEAAPIRKIGIIGAGQMGSGIAHVVALSGYDVALHDMVLETADGTPVGSGLYALACFAGAGLLLLALYRQDRAPAPA